MEQKTQHNQQQRAADAEMHAVESAEIGAATAFAAAVFDIRTVTARCPAHAPQGARRAPTCECRYFFWLASALCSDAQGRALSHSALAKHQFHATDDGAAGHRHAGDGLV